MKFMRYFMSLLMVIACFAFAEASDFTKNEQVRSVLRRSGDNCRIPRVIQHYAYFSGSAELKTYHDFLMERGYDIELEEKQSGHGDAWVIIFSKQQAPVEIDDETALLEANAKRLKGSYDGWDTAVVRQR